MPLTKDEISKIWSDVDANLRRLDGCQGPHEFADIAPDKQLRKRYRCAKCEGEVEAIWRNWYQRGLEHGRAAK